MLLLARFFYAVLLVLTITFSSVTFADNNINIPILCYHNFNPVKPGSMNMTPERLESQLKWIKDNGFTVIPLTEAVAYLQGKRDSLPPKPVVITADDGWESVYHYMYPLARKYNMHITLFIYPATISEGKNAMTWDQLRELQQTGLFDIQSHTYWHPNFKQERKRRSAADYESFVKKQLAGSKKILEEKMDTKITLLAWPFGIYDAYLEQQAADAGYEMAFSIDHHTANKSYKPMAQPRFMIVEPQSMKTFAGMLNGPKSKQVITAKSR